jgi:hypothetical protein
MKSTNASCHIPGRRRLFVGCDETVFAGYLSKLTASSQTVPEGFEYVNRITTLLYDELVLKGRAFFRKVVYVPA